MKKLIAFLFLFVRGSAEIVIRHLISKYMPGYHLHKDPAKKKDE
uniref:Uncharacterized protein n=1 Tax=viral metagenome TaxID=1070528 RepID=A0A6H1ZWR4_9ZZZZ